MAGTLPVVEVLQVAVVGTLEDNPTHPVHRRQVESPPAVLAVTLPNRLSDRLGRVRGVPGDQDGEAGGRHDQLVTGVSVRERGHRTDDIIPDTNHLANIRIHIDNHVRHLLDVSTNFSFFLIFNLHPLPSDKQSNII